MLLESISVFSDLELDVIDTLLCLRRILSFDGKREVSPIDEANINYLARSPNRHLKLALKHVLVLFFG